MSPVQENHLSLSLSSFVNDFGIEIFHTFNVITPSHDEVIITPSHFQSHNTVDLIFFTFQCQQRLSFSAEPDSVHQFDHKFNLLKQLWYMMMGGDI